MENRFVVPIALIFGGIALFAVSLMKPFEAARLLSVPALALLLVGGDQLRRAVRAQQREAQAMDWYDTTEKYHQLTFTHDAQLQSLPEVWQRELAALWRLEADVNNGAYLQFLQNWGKETYVYASQALKKIGAHRMASIIDRCQALVDEHFDWDHRPPEDRKWLAPNEVINLKGERVKGPGSLLPDDVLERIYELSYEFMAYPDDIAALGLRYYAREIEGGNAAP